MILLYQLQLVQSSHTLQALPIGYSRERIFNSVSEMNNPATFGMKWLEMYCSFCPCKKGILPLMQASFQSGFLHIETIAIAKCGNVQCPSTSTRVILPSALCPRRHPVWCLNPPSRAFWWYTLWIHNLPHIISFILQWQQAFHQEKFAHDTKVYLHLHKKPISEGVRSCYFVSANEDSLFLQSSKL